MTTTTTQEDIVTIGQSIGDYSEPWHSISSHSTSPDDQAWFWTTEWQAGEREATLEIQQGQLSRKLHSVEEIRQHLDAL